MTNRRCLFVGNSHTYYNDMPEMVRAMYGEAFADSQSEPRQLDVEDTTGGGVDLEWHWTNRSSRKLLAEHTEETPEDRPPVFNPSFETPEKVWRRQSAQAQSSAFYNQHTGQAARQQAARNAEVREQKRRAQAQNAGDARQTGFNLFSGLGGAASGHQRGGFIDDLFGFPPPQQNYSQAEYERAQANINAQRREQEAKVDKIMKNKNHFLDSLAKALKGKYGKTKGD